MKKHMSIEDIKTFLTTKGYSETRFGHMVIGEKYKRRRYVFKERVLRVEVEYQTTDYRGKPVSGWTRVRSYNLSDIKEIRDGRLIVTGKAK